MKNNIFIKVLENAEQKNIAVGAVNIFNYTTAEAAVKAAKETNTDLIIQTSAGTVKKLGAENIYDFVDSLRRIYGVTAALHLDHCRDKELGRLCVNSGWDSIMMDFSYLPFEENVENTRELAVYAHEHNTAIEGEIGIISGTEEEISSEESQEAGYEETLRFINEAGVDAIAPAIGTAHGVYKGVPNINYELVSQLGKGNTPVVIHGGSGLSAETFRTLILLGARKINISTVVKNTYMDTIKKLVSSDFSDTPIAFDQAVQEAVKNEIKKHLEVFSGMKTSF